MIARQISRSGYHCLAFCVLALPVAGTDAKGPTELHGQTATLDPTRLPFVGIWQRSEQAVDPKVFLISPAGKVLIHLAGWAGAAGAEGPAGRWATVSDRSIQLDLRPSFGHRRLTCRWAVHGDELWLEILQSKSRTDITEPFQVLDEDRSLEGQVWRFRRNGSMGERRQPGQ